jgi:superfamily II DNA/RNA helicase
MDALKEIARELPDGGNLLVFCNSKKKCGEVSWNLDQDSELGSLWYKAV